MASAGDDLSALVLRARSGGADAAAAIEALAARFLRAAYAIALAHVKRAEDAEDVAQDAMIHALANLEDCREPDRFAGWLSQIVRRRALNWVRARRLRDPIGDASHEDADEGPSPELGAHRAELLRALAVLSERERAIVLLHDLEGWTHAEIAAALSVGEVTSRQDLYKARRAMRAVIEAKKKP